RRCFRITLSNLFSFNGINVQARFCRRLAVWIATAASGTGNNAGPPHHCDVLLTIEEECDWWTHAIHLAGLQLQEFVAMISAVCHESSIVQCLEYQIAGSTQRSAAV